MNNVSSMVVPTRNRPDDLARMLHTVAQQTELPTEIIIVDSSDVSNREHPVLHAVFNTLRTLGVHIVYHHTSERGAARQRNIGIDLVQTELIHFMDDDMLLAPDYIERMHAVFARCPDYAGGMGTLVGCLPPKNSCNSLLRRLFLLQRVYANGQFTPSGMPLHPYGRDEFMTVRVLNGCASYRTAIVKEYRFDERLGAYSYMEDCDLSFRVSAKHALFFEPLARLEHPASPHSRLTIVENRRVFMRNYRYLFAKNHRGQRFGSTIAHGWSITGLFFEALLARNWQYLRGYWQGLLD